MQAQQTYPAWCNTREARSWAIPIVFLFWLMSVSMLLSALVCPVPVLLRVAQGVLAGYFLFRLIPMTKVLWNSARSGCAGRHSLEDSAQELRRTG